MKQLGLVLAFYQRSNAWFGFMPFFFPLSVSRKHYTTFCHLRMRITSRVKLHPVPVPSFSYIQLLFLAAAFLPSSTQDFHSSVGVMRISNRSLKNLG